MLNVNNLIKGSERTIIIKKNILGSLLIKGISIFLSLLIVPLTLGYVDSELYGIWLTLSSILIWLNFFDVGFTLGLKNKLTEALSLLDYEKGKYLVSTTYYMMGIIFVPICILLVIIIPFVNWSTFLNVNPVYNEEIVKVLYVLILLFFFQLFLNVLTAVVSAFQMVAFSSIFNVVGQFFSLIVIYLLTKIALPSLLALAFAISAMPVLVLLVSSFVLYKKKFRTVSPSVKYVDKRYVKDLFRLGTKFFIIQVQGVVLFQTTNVLISNISGPQAVTEYNIAYKYLGVAMMVYNIILAPLWPAFTDAYTQRDFGWMRNIYKKMCCLYLLIATVLVVMAFVSPYVYSFWIGDKVSVSPMFTFSITIYMLVVIWDSLQVNMINGIGSVKLQMYVVLVGLFLHIPLALFLGKYFQANGVVVSMSIINFIYCIFFTIQINKIIRGKAIGIWIK